MEQQIVDGLEDLTTNDHTVPQMYLRNFADLRSGRGHYLEVLSVDDDGKRFNSNVRNVAAVRGFYWGTQGDGSEYHDVEKFLGKVETATKPVFTRLLNDKMWVLPPTWPLRRADREVLAWWIACQILRTTRQRARLMASIENSELPPLDSGGRYDANNPHLRYLITQVASLSAIIFNKPWCIGMSDACLVTSDVPVLILNGQDSDDQLLAAFHWDIYLPLDPHRFLLIPGPGMTEKSPAKQRDHRTKFDGGIGLALNESMRASAMSQLFFHPTHNPIEHMDRIKAGPRLPPPGTSDDLGIQFMFSYGALRPEFNIERRWIDTDHSRGPQYDE